MRTPIRRRFLINPSYQLRHAATIFLYIVCYAVIFGFIVFYPLYDSLSSTQVVEEKAQVAAIILYLHKRFWIGFLAIAVLIGIQAIFGTRKVVGPVFRFARTLEALIAGSYMRIRIRSGDEFKEVEALLNRLSERLEADGAADEAARASIVRRLEALRAGIEASDGLCSPEGRRELADLIRELSAPRGQAVGELNDARSTGSADE